MYSNYNTNETTTQSMLKATDYSVAFFFTPFATVLLFRLHSRRGVCGSVRTPRLPYAYRFRGYRDISVFHKVIRHIPWNACCLTICA